MIQSQNVILDAICLQETWLGVETDHSLFQLPNYNFISKPKHCSQQAGLAIYLHKQYNFRIMDISHKSDIFESLFIELPTSKQNKHIILGNIYKPPKENNNNSNIESFICELSPKLHNLARSKAHIIIAGDFNIKILQLKSRPAFSNFFDLMLTIAFGQL